MEDRKIPFFNRLKLAIFNIERYQDFALEKTKVAVKYFVKLILLFCAIICIALTYQYSQVAKDSIELLKNEVPDFTFENNILQSKAEESTFIKSDNKILQYSILIDTDEDISEERMEDHYKKINLYNLGAIFLKDKILIKTQIGNIYNEISYEQIANQYNIQNLDKQGLIQKIEDINGVSLIIALYLTLVLYLFCSYFIATLLETVLLFVLGYLTAKITRVKLTNRQVYSIALYALTLPILLNALYICVNTFTGFQVRYFQVMYTAISYIYLITAILMIRTDLIKQQAEIQKIEEVQEEVKKEMNEKKEEKEDKEKNDDSKEDKDDNKDIGKNGPEPEGTV